MLVLASVGFTPSAAGERAVYSGGGPEFSCVEISSRPPQLSAAGASPGEVAAGCTRSLLSNALEQFSYCLGRLIIVPPCMPRRRGTAWCGSTLERARGTRPKVRSAKKCLQRDELECRGQTIE